jgi:hypothetical protein
MDKVELKKAFVVMAKMQDEINSQVNPDWRHAKYPWWRALWTELGEATGYVQWAWWRNVGNKTFPAPADQLQFFLEMADSLHFGISLGIDNIVRGRGGVIISHDADYQELSELLVNGYEYASTRIVTRDTSLIELIEQTTLSALNERSFNSAYFFAACYRASLDIGALIAYYHGKNLLNRFRQENGYKQGTYRKNWGTAEAPHEDNVALAKLIEEFRSRVGDNNVLPAINAGTFHNWIRQELHRNYTELTKGVSDD